jgi:hypothetical protein
LLEIFCHDVNKLFIYIMNNSNNKRKRCPRGTRKNRKTGICEPKKTKITSKKISEKHTEATPKGQTKLETYYPITRIQKIYKRKPKPPPEIQSKLTQYLKPISTSKYVIY